MSLPLHPYEVPLLRRDKRLMAPVHYNDILFLLVPCFAIGPTVIKNLPAIDRIVQNRPYHVKSECPLFISDSFLIPMLIQVVNHRIDHHPLLPVKAEDHPYKLRLLRLNDQLLIDIPIPIWNRAARPSAFA